MNKVKIYLNVLSLSMENRICGDKWRQYCHTKELGKMEAVDQVHGEESEAKRLPKLHVWSLTFTQIAHLVRNV